MDASVVERFGVDGRWARRMGIRGNHDLTVHYPRNPVKRGGYHHDGPGIVHRSYRRRRYCDLY